MLFPFLCRVEARDAVIGRGDVVDLLVPLVELFTDRGRAERGFDAPVGVGGAAGPFATLVFTVFELLDVVRFLLGVSAAEGVAEFRAGMHGDVHSRAERGIGPLAGRSAPRRPQRDEPRGRGAGGEQEHRRAEHEKDDTGDEGDRSLRQERSNHVRAGHEKVAENAAEPVGKGPALRLRQGGERGGKQNDGRGPGQEPHLPAVGR